MPVQLYEAEVIDGRPDANLPGHIKVKIPQLFRDNEVPTLIPPMYPGSPFGGWQSIPWPVNPDDDSVPIRVIIAHLGGNSFRWLGTSQSWSEVSDNPETRSGARSADGRHHVTLDSDLGVELSASFSDGKTHTLNLNAAGIRLEHEDGVSFLSMESGDITRLNGGSVKISGTTIEMGGGVVPPTHPYFLSLTYLADLSLVMTDIIAIGVAIPTMMPYVAANATSMLAKISTSLSAGAPYLSSRITGD